MAEPTLTAGRALNRDDAGYETARRDTVWRTNMPDRFPECIVQANSVGDVVAAVRAAKAEGRQVACAPGGTVGRQTMFATAVCSSTCPA